MSSYKYTNFSGFDKVVIKDPLCHFSLECEPNKSMKIQGIDIEKHITERFAKAISPDRIIRVILHFSKQTEPKLIATRVYGTHNSSDGGVVSIICFEHNPTCTAHEFTFKERIKNMKSLATYGYSMIIGKTEHDWSSSGYSFKYNFAHKPCRPSRNLVAGILSGLRTGSISDGSEALRKNSFIHDNPLPLESDLEWEAAARAPIPLHSALYDDEQIANAYDTWS